MIDDRRGWHIDKGIGVAHIITTVMLIVTAIWFFAGQDRRIAVLEIGVHNLQQSRLHDQARDEKEFDDLKTDLRLINAKLDRLIEGRNGN